MATTYRIELDTEYNKIIIFDQTKDISQNILNIDDELKRIVWSNNAENTSLNFEMLKNGIVEFIDNSKSKSNCQIFFKDPVDSNSDIFSQVIEGTLGNDLNSFVKQCKWLLGKPKLQY
jgi:hypothetical protein